MDKLCYPNSNLSFYCIDTEDTEEEEEDGRRTKDSHLSPRNTNCFKKKKRTVFTSAQLQQLESKFSEQKYLTKLDRCALAKSLGLTEKHIKTWYQNRRTKWKRDCTEQDWSKQKEHAATLMYSQYLQMKSGKMHQLQQCSAY